MRSEISRDMERAYSTVTDAANLQPRLGGARRSGTSRAIPIGGRKAIMAFQKCP